MESIIVFGHVAPNDFVIRVLVRTLFAYVIVPDCIQLLAEIRS